jgi:hypothetical protein
VKGLKPTLISAIAIGLLAGSAVGVTAQDEEADVAEPVPFTVRFMPSNSVRAAQYSVDRGVRKELGNCWAPVIADPSDPRLAGTLTFCGDNHSYAPMGDTSTGMWSSTYRIENDEGAWQGSIAGAEWKDPESGDMIETDEGLILVGEGDYEGLYAAMTFPGSWSDIRGLIFEGAPPAAPVPPSTE